MKLNNNLTLRWPENLRMRLNRRHILILLLVLIIITIFLPIKLRYSFEATAKIYPLKEWKLMRGNEEGIWSQTIDYETGALSDFRNYRFERGDIAELFIREELRSNDLVNENDTIAEIKSYLIENEITRLENLRDVESANKNVVSTGEKQELILQAERQYNYALQQLDLEKKNIARQEKLYRDSVIPASEFDLYNNTYQLAEINVQVAFEALQSLKTGQKEQVVNVSDQMIISYEKELEKLQAQKRQYTITAPFGGNLNFDIDTLGSILKVRDNSRLLLKIPVAYQHSSYLEKLNKITFSTPDNKIDVDATFKGFDETVSLIQSHQFVIARAITGEPIKGIYPGMVVKCRIYCDKVRILEYLKRNFSVSF